MSCENHKKEVAGLKPPELSKAIVGMHYEALADLFDCLYRDFREAGYKDYAIGKPSLNEQQQMISAYMLNALHHARNLWQISKPFMEYKTTLK